MLAVEIPSNGAMATQNVWFLKDGTLVAAARATTDEVLSRPAAAARRGAEFRVV